MAAVNTFKDRMKKEAGHLTPEAKQIVKYVLAREHPLRFGARDTLPEEYAREALKLAKTQEAGE